MKNCRLFIFIIAILIAIPAYAQTFEGKLVYHNKYTSKVPQVKSEQFDLMMGTRQEYFIKGSNYKSLINGSFVQMQVYLPTDNKLYNKIATSDTLYWNDGKSNTDEVVKYEILRNQEEVLGIRCDALVVETKSGKTTFYFNSQKFVVNPDLYKEHKFGNWSFLMEKMKSLPLKYVMENAQFKVVSVAVEAKEEKLDAVVFKLPPGAPLKASPF